MSRSEVLLLGGEICGLVMRASVTELEKAAALADLSPSNRELMEAVTSFRRQVGEAMRKAGATNG